MLGASSKVYLDCKLETAAEIQCGRKCGGKSRALPPGGWLRVLFIGLVLSYLWLNVINQGLVHAVRSQQPSRNIHT